MNSGCRSQTTCQRRDSINLFCLVADRFGGKTYRQRAEVKFNFFNGTGIAKSLSYNSFRVVFAVQRLCVFKVAAIGFSSTAGPKQTEALLCADTNKNDMYILTQGIKTGLMSANADSFWQNYRKIIFRMWKEQHPGYKCVWHIYGWYLIHLPVPLDFNTTADSAALILRMILLIKQLFLYMSLLVAGSTELKQRLCSVPL